MAKPPNQEKREESDSESSDDEDYVPDDVEDIKSDDDNDSDDSDKGQSDNEADSANDYTTTRSGKRRANTAAKDSSKRPKKDEQPVDHTQDLIKKSKLDALWAEMNAPVVKQPLSKRTESVVTSHGTATPSTGASSSRMVTITTSYEFAGETVMVTKDVPEDSKEAKDFAQKNGANGSIPPGTSSGLSASTDPTATESMTSTPSTTTITSTPEPDSTDQVQSEEKLSQGPKIITRPSILDSLTKKGLVRYVRKKSTLDELAATYGVKKPAKLNTLEKSKLDWNQFVGKEGIEDELKHHNKDGYMEKVAFLQRTDARRDQEYQAMKKKK